MPLNDFFSGLGHIIGKIAGDKLDQKYSGRIPDDRIYRTDGAAGQLQPVPPGGSFVADESYLRVVINQMYLREARNLWVEREHFGAVWMSLRYDGSTRTIPFTLGRDLLLDKAGGLPDGARLEFTNVRVGDVYPYRGDSLSLYLGLWSTPTVNWATTTFGALDIIAGKIKLAGSLSLVLDMVDVLNRGISTVLGLDDIKASLNLYQEFQQPGLGSDVGALRPGYYVMVDAPAASFNPSALAVLDDRLYISMPPDGRLTPFYDYDFLLYHIGSLTGLPAAADRFRKQYDEVVKALVESKLNPSKLAEAAQQYHTLQSQILTNPDLTTIEKSQLLDLYKSTLTKNAVQLAVDLSTGPVSFAPGEEAALPPELPAPTQHDYEAHSARLGSSLRGANPVALAGAAAAEFSALLHDIAGT